ncbi:MAG: serine/threonine-protein kinase [Pseudonocardiaceae bacterium]
MTEEGELIAGRYRLVSQVGSGAMGVVWQAYDDLLHRVVAVKQLLLPVGMSEIQADEATRRAMREGRIAARLHHPHAITVYDVVEHEGKPCLIMEYLHSESLSAVLATQGPLPPEDVARIGGQIAGALAAAHEAGIVHRDIKPGNVLLAGDGTAKITDFGISRAVGDGTVTATGILSGTPAYLAPEVAQGQDATFPSDVFSLGSTLYAAVEGVPPFGLDDNPIALIYRVTTSDITPPSRSGPLTPVLTETLQRNRSGRPTMQQVHETLTAVADSLSSPAPAGPAPVGSVPVGSVPVGRDSVLPPPQADSSAAASAAAPEPPPGGIDRKPRSSTIAITVAVISLIVAGILVVMVVDNGSGTASGVAAPVSSAPATAQSRQPQDPPTPAKPTSPSANPAPTPPTTGGPNPPTGAAPLEGTPQQWAAAVTDYYGLMPGNLPEGWTRLTVDYQRNHAGGLTGYQNFWNAIQRVAVSDVSATQPATVNATITYFYKDGRVIEEQTSFGLVAEDGLWKIGSTTVNASHTRDG